MIQDGWSCFLHKVYNPPNGNKGGEEEGMFLSCATEVWKLQPVGQLPASVNEVLLVYSHTHSPRMVYDCFHTTKTELHSWNRDHVADKT